MKLSTTCIVLCVAALVGCSGHDGDYFPYRMKGFNSYVYDNNSNREYFAGYTDASYLSREKGLASCAAKAYSLANAKHLKNWGYVCCTVTSSSSCATKVR